MSRDAKLAVIGTVALMIWAMVAALSMETVLLRATIGVGGVLLPATGWIVAARRADHRDRDRLLLWVFSAEFVVVLLIDVLRWYLHRPIPID